MTVRLMSSQTGLPLAKDSSVAIIQLQNEDSMLFWTMQGIKGAQPGATNERSRISR